MPYGRRYRKRPMRRRRRNRRKGFSMSSALALAKSALAGVRYLKGLVNSEKYNVDTTFTTSTFNTGTVTSLVPIAQGDGESDRTGLSVYVRSLSLRGQISASSTTQSTTRLILFRDKQQIADSTPSAANLLSSPAQVDSYLSRGTGGRFDILYDKSFVVSGNDAGRPQQWVNITIPMRSHVRYNGTATTDLQKNGLYLLHMSDRSDGSGTAPTLNLTTRVYYHDN